MRLGPVVPLGGARRGAGGDPAEPGGAPGLALELERLRGGVEVGVQEVAADQGIEEEERLLRRVVLGHVPGRMAPDEAQAGAAPDDDGPDVQVPERGIGSAVFSERQLGQGAPAHG